MKTIEVDDELYHYIASRTQAIGESASDILRRLLRLPASPQPFVLVQENMINELKHLAKLPPTKKQPPSQADKIAKHVEFVLASHFFQQETKMVNRFLMVLAALYHADSELFAQATERVQGNERVYFARDEQAILATGRGATARQIPDSPFWVITNNNSKRKGIIIGSLMEAMGLSNEFIYRIRGLFV